MITKMTIENDVLNQSEMGETNAGLIGLECMAHIFEARQLVRAKITPARETIFTSLSW